MQFTMTATENVKVSVAPADAAGNASSATLSNVVFASSDPTIFSVAADPANHDGAIVTGIKVGTANLTVNATATEADGKTTESITGTVAITLTVGAAAALVFTFGTPSPNL